MKYSVHFTSDVRDAVAIMIAGARDSEYLSECVIRIDTALRADPFAVGEGRESDEERFHLEGPLAVHYEVDRRAARVLVTELRRVG